MNPNIVIPLNNAIKNYLVLDGIFIKNEWRLKFSRET